MKKTKQEHYEILKRLIIEFYQTFPNKGHKEIAWNFKCLPSFVSATISNHNLSLQVGMGNEERYFNSLKYTPSYKDFYADASNCETVGQVKLSTLK